MSRGPGEPPSEPPSPREEEERQARRWSGHALAAGFQDPWATRALVSLMACVHIAVGLVMWSEDAVNLAGVVVSPRPAELLIITGAMWGQGVSDGQFWRLVSCVFLHGDGVHMLLNGVALFGLGRLCEAIYGPSRFLWLFLVSGVAGATLSWLGGNALSVGASGGIFALMGAGIVFGWRYRRKLPEPVSHLLRRQLLPWVGLNLFIGVVVPFIDNLGHVGGLVCGAGMAMVVGNRVVPGEESPAPVRFTLLIASLVVLAYAAAGVASSWATWSG